ncbi:MAG: cupin domain-containing protein, partial [Ktedonobacteraceae bacterium]|nr:cupin domain-containing protein [Ktedonobacteraceae bacterium]
MSLEKNLTTSLIIDLFGPTIAFLTLPEEIHNDFCVLRGTIPPGARVPLHSHPDTEDFLVLSGEVEGLKYDKQNHEWMTAKAEDYMHVPAGAPHAWRNVSSEPVVTLIITTKRLGRFFQEAGRPIAGTPQPVTQAELAHFASI